MGRHRTSRDIEGVHPDEVFAFVTDIERLPTWNDTIGWIEQQPPTLTPGEVWKVRMHQGPMVWVSRSVVVEHNTERRLFVHRSGTDDGNPSFTEWRWTVSPWRRGSTLTVEWDLRPATRLRRWFAAPVRAQRLLREVPDSLDRMEEALRGHRRRHRA